MLRIGAGWSSRCSAFKLLTHTKSAIWDVSLKPWSRSQKVGSRSANVQTHGLRENMSQGAPATPVSPGWGCAAHPCGFCSIQTCLCAWQLCQTSPVINKPPNEDPETQEKPQTCCLCSDSSDFVSPHFYRKPLFLKNVIYIWTLQPCSAECGPW